MTTNYALELIKEERERQDAKWGEQNHDPQRWLVILMEELGEASEAILRGSAFDYIDELTQVAAVAVAAMESATREKPQ